MFALRVLLINPEIAARSCSDCQQFLYYDRGPGEFGDVVMRGGKKQPRQRGQKTPCWCCPKIAPGDEPKPENAQELSDRNTMAFLFHRECAAVGHFPNDAIVRRNAAIIADAMSAADRVERARSGQIALGSIFRET